MIFAVLLSLAAAAPSVHLQKRAGCAWWTIEDCRSVGESCAENDQCRGDNTLCFVDNPLKKEFSILNKPPYPLWIKSDSPFGTSHLNRPGICQAQTNFAEGAGCSNQNDLSLCGQGLKCMVNNPVTGWRMAKTCSSGNICERGQCQVAAKENTLDNPEGRLDCSKTTVDEAGCKSLGCIWSPLDLGSDLPWCYRPTPPEPREGRTECGSGVTSDAQCKSLGCTWSPLEDSSKGKKYF
jgi:hypothetical protein